MKLPIPSLSGKKPSATYYLALLLRDEKATAIILKELDGNLQTISSHEELFETSLEEASMEEWLEVLDKTISRAEEALPPDLETHKTVFGVKETWVEEKHIKKEYLSKLKKVSESLDLSPIGFLVISEAITHLLAQKEGAPITALVTEITHTKVFISLFKAGKLLDSREAVLHDSPAEDVDTLLQTFPQDVLPSRIIVFDGGREKDLAQSFIAHHWSKAIPFLHMPQIAVLPRGFDSQAVVAGAATQLGFMYEPKALEHITTGTGKIDANKEKQPEPDATSEEEKSLPQMPELDKSDEPSPEVSTKNEKEEHSLDKPETSIPGTPTAGQAAFGFAINEDVANRPEEKPEKETEQEEKQESADTEKPEPLLDRPVHSDNLQSPEDFSPASHHDTQSHTDRKALPPILATVLTKLRSLKTSIPSTASLPNLPLLRGNKMMLLIPLALVIFVAGVAGYLYLLHAQITIHVQPKQFSDTETVTFAVDGSNDFSGNTIAAKTVTATADGSASTPTTGKKAVGDSAKGTVTLYNSDDTKKTLPAGTTLTSSNGIEFTTDKDVTVASASGDIFTGITSGKTDVSVTAKDIGTEANLPSGTKFSVEGASSIAGKNDTAFSGGTKKDVQVVAQKDLTKLVSDLPTNLQDQAKSQLSQQITGNEVILPFVLDSSVTKKQYDKAVGDQANTVTLKATATFSEAVYDKTDLSNYADQLVKGKADSSLHVDSHGIQTNVANLKQNKDGSITGTISISAGLLPNIDTAKLQTAVTGKSATEAENLIHSQPQVQSVDIILTPNLPFIPKTLPKLTKHISVTLDTNG